MQVCRKSETSIHVDRTVLCVSCNMTKSQVSPKGYTKQQPTALFQDPKHKTLSIGNGGNDGASMLYHQAVNRGQIGPVFAKQQLVN